MINPARVLPPETPRIRPSHTSEIRKSIEDIQILLKIVKGKYILVDWYALICIIDRVVFEWDEDKAAANLETHDVGFEEAVLVFADENAIEEFDTKHSIDEERFMRIGLSDRRVLFVVYAVRVGDVVRILHARKANKRMKRLYEQTKKDKS